MSRARALNGKVVVVTVTQAAGVVLLIQRILPGGVADALRRSIGLDHLFTDRVDVGKRAA